jgi:hypothetical protein
LFAVSVFPFSTAARKTGRRVKAGGTTMATRQTKAGWVERLKQSFHASGTNKMEWGTAISIMSLSFGMLGFVILGLTIIEHL